MSTKVKRDVCMYCDKPDQWCIQQVVKGKYPCCKFCNHNLKGV